MIGSISFSVFFFGNLSTLDEKKLRLSTEQSSVGGVLLGYLGLLLF